MKDMFQSEPILWFWSNKNWPYLVVMGLNGNFQSGAKHSLAQASWSWANQFSSWNQADNMYVNKEQILAHVKNYN